MNTSSSLFQNIFPITPQIAKNQPVSWRDTILPTSTSLGTKIPQSNSLFTFRDFDDQENQVNRAQANKNKEDSRVLRLEENHLSKDQQENIDQGKKEKKTRNSLYEALFQVEQASSTKKTIEKQDIHVETTDIKANRDFPDERKKVLSNIDNRIPNALLNSSKKISVMFDEMKDKIKETIDLNVRKGNTVVLRKIKNEQKPFNNLTDKVLAQTMIYQDKATQDNLEFGRDKLMSGLDHVLENTDLDVKINFQKRDQAQDTSSLNPLKHMFKKSSKSERAYGFLDFDFLGNDEVKKEEEVAKKTVQREVNTKKMEGNLIDSLRQASEKDAQIIQEESKEAQINAEFAGIVNIGNLSQEVKNSVQEEKEVISIGKGLESVDKQGDFKDENKIEPKDIQKKRIIENKKYEPNVIKKLDLKSFPVRRTKRSQAKSWPPKKLKTNIELQEPELKKKISDIDKVEPQPRECNINETKGELKENEANNNWQDSNNFSQENILNLANDDPYVKGKKYSVYEDWRIIESVATHYQNHNGEYLSCQKWAQLKDPLTGKEVLGDTRTRDSLRNRYVVFLSELKKEDLERIQKFIEDHSEEAKSHYIKFKTNRTTKEKKLFDIVKIEDRGYYKNRSKKEEEPEIKSSESKKRKEPYQSSLVINPQNLFKRVKQEHDCREKLPQVQISIPPQQANLVKDELYVCVDLENESRQFVRDEEVKKDNKVKDFSGDIWQELSVLSEKYKISINKLNVLLGQVSYSFEDLKRYLETQQPMILWSAEEDRDVVEGSEIALRYLKMIKGEQSVERRRKYLMDF